MGTRENNLAKNIKLTLPPGQKMIRFNVAGKGSAYVGNPREIITDYYDPKTKKVGVFIPEGRQLIVGKKGWSDYIGYTPVKITPEMVGNIVAVFTGAEAKTGNQKLRTEQTDFKNQIVKDGGIHEEWREPDKRIITGMVIDLMA